ncbi:MAG: helix-turn-helix transcriptional regulator [Moritella sp.]|uniref:helix-turn-helix transcriptional regulator n=1 Tax=Moritella sp. TaxID=78556 RepID=UPI0029AD6A0B|nr:helix-turn-helix transcriptional regulator [Moritella sp.]MDX2322271.1 helix-turn-helix transcriptional regulator [Moritella sp.]
MKPNVWAIPGIFMFYGSSLEAKSHKHNAIQIVWPSACSTVTILDTQVVTPLIIASDITHKLEMQAGWVILVEPQSWLGVLLSAYLQNDPYRQITNLARFTSANQSVMVEFAAVATILTPLLLSLNITWQQSDEQYNINGNKLDDRINSLLHRLNGCFGKECLKPNRWRANAVASELAISESRFLHLFRQEMGIAWRPYLLWRRLLCAVQAIEYGKNATESAYLAGFSDSAHLSRTFHNTFGMTLRDAKLSLNQMDS